MAWLVWIIIALLCLAGEAATTALVLASFGVAAAIVAALSLTVSPAVQVVAFAGVSLVLLFVARPAVLRILPGRSSAPTPPQIGPVGRHGTAVQLVDRKGGQIRIGTGEFWSARPAEPDLIIPAGTDVEVVRMEGLLACVRPASAPAENLVPEPGRQEPAPDEAAPFGLSPRELEVLNLVALGLSNGEIAERLYLSPRTVHHHVTHILNKMGAAGRVEAVRLAIDRGLVKPRAQP